MGYDLKIYNEAVSRLNASKAAAEERAERNLNDFYLKCPKAMEIREEMASNAAGIAKAVLSGGDVRAALEEIKAVGVSLKSEFDLLLSENDYKSEDIAPQYSCKDCGDTGFKDGMMCHCLKNLQKELAYERLRMSVPVSKCTFDDFSLSYYSRDEKAARQMELVFKTCKRYAELFRADSPSFLFKGGNGLGKTHLALAIANSAIEKGFGVIYGSSQNFAVSLERERFISSPDADDTATQLISCDFLIIDDLGTEFASAYASAAIYNVVDTRIMTSKPTVITTNLSMREMEERYGERFVSRINGCYNKLEFLGSDIRNLKRKEKTAKSQAED